MTATSLNAKPRKGWIAGLFNLLAPGLGFLYLGRLRVAFAVPALLVAWLAFTGWSRLIFSPLGFYFTFAVYFAIFVGSIVVAVMQAKRSGAVAMKAYPKWYVYLAFGLLSLTALNVVTQNRGPLFGYDHYRFPSKSMSPTLQFGDFILADRRAYSKATPQRGDIVVFEFPRDSSISYVKRVIGLPGDKVSISGGVVSVNGSELAEPYVLPESNVRHMQDGMDVVLRPDSYFVLGDNRDNSNDSRYWGPVSREAMLGKVLFVWMHYDPENGFDPSRAGVLVK